MPGRPDLVFPRRRKVIFVHGCFWHRHEGCADCSQLKSRQEYWEPKFARTKARDAKTLELLAELGWDALVIWECETTDEQGLNAMLTAFLEGS